LSWCLCLFLPPGYPPPPRGFFRVAAYKSGGGFGVFQPTCFRPPSLGLAWGFWGAPPVLCPLLTSKAPPPFSSGGGWMGFWGSRVSPHCGLFCLGYILVSNCGGGGGVPKKGVWQKQHQIAPFFFFFCCVFPGWVPLFELGFRGGGLWGGVRGAFFCVTGTHPSPPRLGAWFGPPQLVWWAQKGFLSVFFFSSFWGLFHQPFCAGPALCLAPHELWSQLSVWSLSFFPPPIFFSWFGRFCFARTKVFTNGGAKNPCNPTCPGPGFLFSLWGGFSHPLILVPGGVGFDLGGGVFVPTKKGFLGVVGWGFWVSPRFFVFWSPLATKAWVLFGLFFFGRGCGLFPFFFPFFPPGVPVVFPLDKGLLR